MEWDKFFSSFWFFILGLVYLGVAFTSALVYLWLAVQAWNWLL